MFDNIFESDEMFHKESLCGVGRCVLWWINILVLYHHHSQTSQGEAHVPQTLYSSILSLCTSFLCACIR